MKVSELVSMLENMDQNADVHICYNYGDYWRTTVAPKASDVFEGDITYSDYHRMPKLVEYAGDLDAGATLNNVVLIG